MSDALLSQALAEAYACAPSNVVALDTLEINHPLLDEPLRLVNDYANLTAKIETGETVTFIRFAFVIKRAEVNAQGQPEVTLTVDNASAEISQLLDSIADSPDEIPVITRTYRSDDLTGPAGRNLPGEVSHINVADVRVTLRVTYGQVANRPFPGELYTPFRFPGLVR